MLCNSCNKENRADGKFCRFCGSKLGQTKNSIIIKIPNIKDSFNKFIGVVRKQDKKAILIAVVVIGVSAGTVFAAPKINDYIKVNKSISESKRLESIGDYNAALAALVLTSDKWTFESKRQEIESIKEDQTKYAQFKESSEIALEKEESGKLAEARELLRTIDADYPEYEKVKEKLDQWQEGIENNLKERARLKELEAQRQTAAATAARQQVEIETAARTRAEAEKAASDAQSRAAAQAARDSEARRQQEEVRRAEEVRKSFVNQLVTGYNSYNQGVSYYSSAISYSNNGDSLVAISQANAATAVLNTARNSVSDLNSRFDGLPSDYYTAVDNMLKAIDYLNRALSLLIQSEGTSLDYSSTINSNKNLAQTYMNRVKSFFDSN